MRHTSLVASLLCLMCLAAGPAAAAAQTTPPVKAATVVNINTATAEQLEALPGIGARMAARIVEHRQKNGGFKKIEDLMSIRGIGEKNFLKLKPLITVGPAKSAGGPVQ